MSAGPCDLAAGRIGRDVMVEGIQHDQARHRHRRIEAGRWASAALVALALVLDLLTPIGAAAGALAILAVATTLVDPGLRSTPAVAVAGLVALAAGALAEAGSPARLAGRGLGGVARAAAGALVQRAKRREAEERAGVDGRLEGLRLAAIGAAHDLRNLLMVLSASASPEDEEERELLEDETRKAGRILDGLTRYARTLEPEPVPTDLAVVVGDLSLTLRGTVGDAGELDLDLQEAPLVADRRTLEQIVLNLVSNAARALRPPSGRVRVRTGITRVDEATLRSCPLRRLAPGRCAFLEVEDEGTDVPDFVRGRLFQPWGSTRPGGIGAGLATVAWIVRSRGGAIEVETAPGRGTRVRVWLPSEPAGASAGLEEVHHPGVERGRSRPVTGPVS